MKKIITLIAVLILGQLIITAQTALIQSIDSGGESTTGSIHAVYNIGETAVGEFSDTTLQVTEGFVGATFAITTLNIPNAHKPKIAFYPNPALHTVFIDYPSEKAVTYSVLDVAGKELSTQHQNGQKHRINVQQLPKGTYIVKAVSGNTAIGTFKLLKR